LVGKYIIYAAHYSIKTTGSNNESLPGAI